MVQKKKKSKCGGKKDKARRLKATSTLASVVWESALFASSSASDSSEEPEDKVPDQDVLDVGKKLVEVGSMGQSRLKRLAKRQQKHPEKVTGLALEAAGEDGSRASLTGEAAGEADLAEDESDTQRAE
jgi:hypothetical protein